MLLGVLHCGEKGECVWRGERECEAAGGKKRGILVEKAIPVPVTVTSGLSISRHAAYIYNGPAPLGAGYAKGGPRGAGDPQAITAFRLATLHGPHL